MATFHLVDAFTDVAFAGNPAGVVLLDSGPVDGAWAQRVAAEVGASETAFLLPETGGAGAGDGSRWQLRWWTPAAEVDLCGHATLAAAHVLRARGLVAAGATVGFDTRSGTLTARCDPEGRIWLDLPAWPVADHAAPGDLTALLGGVEGRYLGRTGVAQANDVVEVAGTDALDAVAVDRDRVTALGSAGLIVCCGGAGSDAAMRYFAPALGVDEDPVTGSAACSVAPLWAGRLGRSEVTIEQRSARGGWLWARVGGSTAGGTGDGGAAGRVLVGGHAVTTIVGELVVS